MASQGQRLAAWLLDGLFAGLAALPFLAALAVAGLLDGDKSDAPVFFALVIALVIGGILLTSYLDGERGGTPGKRIMGIRWADRATGDPLGWGRALVALFSLRIAHAVTVRNERDDGR